MRVVFLSYGTRGDAQPQVALAEGLQARGVQTRVAAPENLEGFVAKAGAEYAPLFGNSKEIMESEKGQRWLRSGNVRAFMKEVANISKQIDPDVFRMGLEAVHDADAIVGGTLAEDLAYTLAEYKKIPIVFGHTIPFEPTREYPQPFVTTKALPFGFLNRVTFALVRKLLTSVHAESLTTFRASLGLAPLRATAVSRAAELGVPTLQLWSKHLVPHPADAGPKTTTTGFVRLPAAVHARLGETSPSEALTTWLDAGPPPVYIGFGSMPMPASEAFTHDLLVIAKELDIRIAMSGGWNDLEPVRHLACDQLHFIDAVDHRWLFPRCAAVVHHGGAGTTSTSVESGVPTVVCSVFADQPFWGARVQKLGVGVHLRMAKLNRARLTAALRRVLGEDVRRAARAMGEKLRAEDGGGQAVDALLSVFGQPTASAWQR